MRSIDYRPSPIEQNLAKISKLSNKIDQNCFYNYINNNITQASER